MKIMIVEDDNIISKELKKFFISQSFDVYIAGDFLNIMGEINRENPQLILLDINLPTNNGYSLCMEIRKFSNIPIIFISSRNDNFDQVMAMQMGGDDYIVKPFDMNLLLAKIKALLRRTYDFSKNQIIMKKGNLEFDVSKASLSYGNKNVELTKTELQIIEILFQNFNEFISRERIMDYCWQGENFIDDNTLAVNIYRLRKKIANLGIDNLIETRTNIGYRLNEAVL